MIYVIGIDPGPTPGLVALHVTAGRPALPAMVVDVDIVQCSQRVLVRVLDGLWDSWGCDMRLAIEQFVVGPRASRSRTATAGKHTRELINEIHRWVGVHKLSTLSLRQAADVKPWATDTRLDRAGLLAPTAGMRHARDAARHALFSAVRDHGLPDPLSKKAGGT